MNLNNIELSDTFFAALMFLGIFVVPSIMLFFDGRAEKKNYIRMREDIKLEKIKEAERLECEAKATIRANLATAAAIKKLVETHKTKGHTSDALIRRIGEFVSDEDVAFVRAVICTQVDCEQAVSTSTADHELV